MKTQRNLLLCTTTAIVLGLTLSACSPYSRDDLAFALAIPPKEDVALAPPGVEVEDESEGEANQSAASSALSPVCNDSDLRCTAQTTARSFNRLTIGLLAIIDGIVSRPPTYRGVLDGEPRRIWGPAYVRDMDSTIRFEMVLDTQTNSFELCLAAARGNLDDKPSPDEMTCDSDPRDFGMLQLMGGRFQPGEIQNGRARSGAGELVLDGNALTELDPRDAMPGVFTITYDNRTTTQTITVGITDIPQNLLAEAAYAFTRNKETGAGTFAFSVLEDFTPGIFGVGFAQERLDVTAQWDGTLAGRGDARISGGDLDDFTYDVTHCWGEDFVTTYFEDPDDNHPTVGDVSNCVFDEPFVGFE